MVKQNKKKGNELGNIFKLGLMGASGVVVGGALGFMLIGLYSLFFCGLGYYLIVKNNKPHTKPFEDLQKEQYLGAFLFSIGLLPWIRYFFISFMLSAGESFYEDNFE